MPGAHVWEELLEAPINPLLDTENCSACVHALDSTLAGHPAQALAFAHGGIEGGMEGLLARLATDPAGLARASRTLLRRFEQVAERRADLVDGVAALRAELDALRADPSLLGAADDAVRRQLAMAFLLPHADPAGLAELFGRRADAWHSFESMAAAEAHVTAWPARAKGIVSVERADEASHVFNVLRTERGVQFLDGQLGVRYGRDAFEGGVVAVLRTDDVPRDLDLRALRLGLGVDAAP